MLSWGKKHSVTADQPVILVPKPVETTFYVAKDSLSSTCHTIIDLGSIILSTTSAGNLQSIVDILAGLTKPQLRNRRLNLTGNALPCVTHPSTLNLIYKLSDKKRKVVRHSSPKNSLLSPTLEESISRVSHFQRLHCCTILCKHMRVVIH